MKNWQKEYIRQVKIWLLQIQCTLDMIHFGEHLSTAVCSAKHAHYFTESMLEACSLYRNWGYGKQET